MTTIIYCRNSFKNLIQKMVETETKRYPKQVYTWPFTPVYTWSLTPLVWHRHFIHDLLHPWCRHRHFIHDLLHPGMAQALHTWHFTPLVWYRHFIHDLVHPCYGTGTSIQNDNAKLVLWVQTSPLSEMMRLFTYFPHMSTMPTLHITRWASLL